MVLLYRIKSGAIYSGPLIWIERLRERAPRKGLLKIPPEVNKAFKGFREFSLFSFKEDFFCLKNIKWSKEVFPSLDEKKLFFFSLTQDYAYLIKLEDIKGQGESWQVVSQVPKTKKGDPSKLDSNKAEAMFPKRGLQDEKNDTAAASAMCHKKHGIIMTKKSLFSKRSPEMNLFLEKDQTMNNSSFLSKFAYKVYSHFLRRNAICFFQIKGLCFIENSQNVSWILLFYV